MSHKFGGARGAVGYWGGSPNKRVRSGQIPEQIGALERDKLLTAGRPVYLYLPLTNVESPQLSKLLNGNATVACTCEKETTKTSDDRCFSCYGVKQIPGYVRFLTETIFFSSAEISNYTLTQTRIDRQLKPNRIGLDTSEVTGTVETNDKAYSNPNGDDWTFETHDFVRDAAQASTFTYEFSTDAGGTYFPIADINGANKPTGTGTIRFRITITRPSASDKNPLWEVLRLRRLRSEDVNQFVVTAMNKDPDFSPGKILIARTWVIERTIRDAGRGRNTDHSGDKAWTTPLDFFDTSITAETLSAAVVDRESGPHPFYESCFGIRKGMDRYALYQESYSEQLLVFTHQAFFDRLVQKNENYHLVF